MLEVFLKSSCICPKQTTHLHMMQQEVNLHCGRPLIGTHPTAADCVCP